MKGFDGGRVWGMREVSCRRRIKNIVEFQENINYNKHSCDFKGSVERKIIW